MFSEQLSCCERSYLCDKKQGQLLTQGKLNTLHKIKIEFVIRNWLKMKFVTKRKEEWKDLNCLQDHQPMNCFNSIMVQ